MLSISRVALLLVAFAAASAGRAQGVRLPEFSAITRTSPATVRAPADVAFNFTLTPGTSAVRDVSLTFRTPTGAAFVVTTTGKNTLGTSVSPGATNGTYTLDYALVTDAWDRMLFYRANGTVEARGGTSNAAVAPGVAIVPTAHSLDFSALSFEVTGGIAQPQPPRLISLTRRSPAIVGLGEFAEFDYVIQPGTNALRSVRLSFVIAPLSIGRVVTTLLTTSATNGTIRLPITNDLPPQPAQVQAVEITDDQGRVAVYLGPSLQDVNYTGSTASTANPFNFADYSFGIVGTNGTAPQPRLTALTRTPAGAALTVGNTLSYAYTLNLDGVVAQTIVARILGPYGLARSVNLAAANGTFSLPIEADWIAGSYQLQRFTVTDASGQGYTVTPATDSFGVSGGVGAAPTITRQPTAEVFTLGSIDLSVNATSTGAITYQWYEGLPGDTSHPVPNGDRQSLQMPTTTTTYFVRVTANGESVDSNVVRVTVVALPVITTPVAHQSTTVGGTVTFSVEAQSNGPVRYQWSGNGIDTATATQASVTLRNVQASWAGNVRVEVSNLAGTVANNALLNVRVSDAPLRITEQPQGGLTSANGPTIYLHANATGNPPLYYQWQRDGGDIGYYQGFMSSGGGTTLPVAPSQFPAGSYRLKVTNGFETVYSEPAVVSWAALPVITSQTRDISVEVGHTAALSVNVLGEPPLTYQWRRNGVPLPGQTSSLLAVGEVTSGYAGSYDVVITNGAGSVTSVPAALTITTAPRAVAPPEITYPPLFPRSITLGEDVFLQVDARGSNLIYSWRRDGRIIGTPSTSPALYLRTLASSDSGTYDVVVSNELGQVISLRAYIEVTSSATAPVIIKQPKAQVVRAGETLELTALANGAAPMTWQWRFNGQPLTATPTVQWTTTPSLLITPISTDQAGTYDAVVTNSLGQTTTTAVIVGVENSYPAITTRPSGGSQTLNNSFTLAMQATAPTGTVTYEWVRNGTPLGAASATGTRELLFMQPADAGIYTGMAAANGSTSRTYAIVGLQSGVKVVGTGSEVGQDIRHANGNIYDQILLTGPAATVIPDLHQILRLSYLDLSDDIVQVEMSGQGNLSIVLENYSPAAAPAKYNQPGISYVKGHATIVITNASADTHLSVFSVGSITAVNQALFRSDVTYDGVADIAAVAIQSGDGKFGGLRMANASFEAASGVTGIYAPDVTFTGPVYLHDIKAQGTAVPMMVLGSAATVGITGGSLAQPNQAPVAVSGISHLESMDGVTSFGEPLPRQPLQARFLQDGVEVTAKVTAP